MIRSNGYTLTCDNPECENKAVYLRRWECVQYGRRDGWTVGSKSFKDRCPTCAKKEADHEAAK